LHLLLENTEGLLNIVVSDKYLQLILLAWAANATLPAGSQMRRSFIAILRIAAATFATDMLIYLQQRCSLVTST
jgi:hypothetical protein